jgi:hypothetical protein
MCPKAKNDTNYKIQNPMRRCANCGGGHGSRYKGCPDIQKTKSWLKESLEKNIPLRDIKKQEKVQKDIIRTEVINQDKGVIEMQRDLHTQVITIDDKEIVAQDIIKQFKEIQFEIQRDLAKITQLTQKNEELLEKIESERMDLSKEAKREIELKCMKDFREEIKHFIGEMIPMIIEEVLRKQTRIEQLKTAKHHDD